MMLDVFSQLFNSFDVINASIFGRGVKCSRDLIEVSAYHQQLIIRLSQRLLLFLAKLRVARQLRSNKRE